MDHLSGLVEMASFLTRPNLYEATTMKITNWSIVDVHDIHWWLFMYSISYTYNDLSPDPGMNKLQYLVLIAIDLTH